jgi:YVTN family beta-propeller protein
VAIAGNSVNNVNSKIYVVNNGSNNVTVISTIDSTVLKTIPVGSHPIWGVMADNGIQVFIVNQGDGTATNPGSVSVIDTSLDTVIPCSGTGCNATTGAISLGFTPATSSPNFAFYDGKRQRLYVSNTGESSISVIKADGINLGVTPQVVPSLLANISITAPPTSVAALSDGSKAYAALGGCPSGTNHTNLLARLASCTGSQVSVIDTNALAEITPAINVGAGAVSIDAAADASRVYVVGAQAGNISIIRTTSNTVSTTLTPALDSSCTSNCTHIPFMVRIFP